MLDHTDKVDDQAPAGMLIVLLGSAAVFVLALLGVEMTRAAGNVASIWLPNVLAVGLVLRLQGSMRAVSFLLSAAGIFAANMVYGDVISISIGLTVANMLEIATALALLSALGFRRQDIVTTSGFFRFVGVSGLVAPVVGGLIGAAVLNELVGAPFLPVWQTWLMSGVLGAVILGPAVVTPVIYTVDRRPRALWEIAGWSLVSAAVIWLTSQTDMGYLIYLLPSLVIAAGIRLGLTASALVGAVLAVYIAWNVVAGIGSLPFEGDLLGTQIFLLTAILVSHVVALLWQQRINLEAEKANYLRAVQASKDGFLFVDADDRFVAWNEALTRMMPWIPENTETGQPAFRRENLLLLARIRAGETISDMPLSRTDGGDGANEFLLSAAPIFEDQIYQGATVSIRDVTESERLRRTVRQRAAELEAFIDATPDIVIGTDADGVVTVWNRMAEEFHGLPRHETLGKKIFEIGSSTEARALRERNFRRIMSGESIENVRSTRIRADGVERILMLSIKPVRDDTGQIIGSMANHRDVTELSETRQDADRYQMLLDNAFTAISDGLAIFDAQERLVRSNTAYDQQISGSLTPSLVGQTWEELVRRNLKNGNIDVPESEWEDWISDRRQKISAGGNTFIMQLRDNRWLLGNDYPIDGGGFISVRQDITKLKQTQEMLEMSNAELEQFAFVASHDLQEPLRKINSFGSILVSEYADNLPEDAQRFLQSMMRSASRMQDLIQDLLTYSRIQEHKSEPVTCNLADMARVATSNLQKQISDAGATVQIGDLGEARSDRAGIIRVIQIVVENAITYRHPDRPPRIEILPLPDEGKNVVFSIRDNGRGFDMRYADQIMEPFKRLHSQSEIPGTGMGLAIARKVLNATSGEIRIHGDEGQGAEFTIVLPGVQPLH